MLTLLLALLSLALAAPVPTEASRALAQGDAAPPEKKITAGGALLAGGLAATGHNTAAGITVAAQGAPLAGLLIANRDKKEQRRSIESQAAGPAPELARSADAAPPEKKMGLGGLLLDGALLATDHDTAAGVAIASQGHPLAGFLIAEEGKKDHEEGHEDHGRRADVSEEKSTISDAVAAASYHDAPEEKSMLGDTAAGVAIASQSHPLAGFLIVEEGKKGHEEGHEDHGRRADVSEEKSTISDAVAAASYHDAPEEKSMLGDAVGAATYHNTDGTRDLEDAIGDDP